MGKGEVRVVAALWKNAVKRVREGRRHWAKTEGKKVVTKTTGPITFFRNDPTKGWEAYHPPHSESLTPASLKGGTSPEI